jgi:hypothetical protein
MTYDRNYWCMRFEAMNQVLKRMATGSNYINLLGRLAEFWAIKTARDSKFSKTAKWGLTEILSQFGPRWLPCSTQEQVPIKPHYVLITY